MKKLFLLLLLSFGLIGNSYSETKVLSYQTEVAYQSKLAYDAKVAQLMLELEAKKTRQAALKALQLKLAVEQPAMMMMELPYVNIWKCKKDSKKSENSCIREKLEAILINKGIVKPSQGEESTTVDLSQKIIQAKLLLDEGTITEEELNEIIQIIINNY